MDLTPEAFEMLLARLDSNRDEAGRKYVELRRTLVKFLGFWGCNSPEDQADEAIGRIAANIHRGAEIENLNSWALGVAQLVYKESLRLEIRMRNAMKHRPPEAEVDRAGEGRCQQCYRRCLRRLPSEEQDLIVRYYRGPKAPDREKLAEWMGISLNLLRVSAFRIRQKLGRCLQECYEQQSEL